MSKGTRRVFTIDSMSLNNDELDSVSSIPRDATVCGDDTGIGPPNNGVYEGVTRASTSSTSLVTNSQEGSFHTEHALSWRRIGSESDVEEEDTEAHIAHCGNHHFA